MIEIFIQFIPDYEVSNFGQIRNIKTKRFRKPQIRNGYPAVYIRGRNYNIHRLVAMYFVHNPNPDKYFIINHIDNNPKNAKFNNLEWCDQRMNIQHQILLGNHTCQTSIKSKNARFKSGAPSKVTRKSKSGIKGITVKHGVKGTKYLVYFHSKTHGPLYAGTFVSLEEAKHKYKILYLKRYGIDPYET